MARYKQKNMVSGTWIHLRFFMWISTRDFRPGAPRQWFAIQMRFEWICFYCNISLKEALLSFVSTTEIHFEYFDGSLVSGSDWHKIELFSFWILNEHLNESFQIMVIGFSGWRLQIWCQAISNAIEFNVTLIGFFRGSTVASLSRLDQAA